MQKKSSILHFAYIRRGVSSQFNYKIEINKYINNTFIYQMDYSIKTRLRLNMQMKIIVVSLAKIQHKNNQIMSQIKMTNIST